MLTIGLQSAAPTRLTALFTDENELQTGSTAFALFRLIGGMISSDGVSVSFMICCDMGSVCGGGRQRISTG